MISTKKQIKPPNYAEKYNKGNPVLAERLKMLRIERDLTQEELADSIDTNGGKCKNASYISMLESAKRPISKTMAYCLSRIFGINPLYLLDETVEYKTIDEHLDTVLEEPIQENNLIFTVICSLAALNGYTVEIQKLSGDGNVQIEDVFRRMNEYMVFYQDGKKVFSLSLSNANRFGNLLSDIFTSHIEWKKQK